MKEESTERKLLTARNYALLVLTLGSFQASVHYDRMVHEHPDWPMYEHGLGALLFLAVNFFFVWCIPVALVRSVSWLLRRRAR